MMSKSWLSLIIKLNCTMCVYSKECKHVLTKELYVPNICECATKWVCKHEPYAKNPELCAPDVYTRKGLFWVHEKKSRIDWIVCRWTSKFVKHESLLT